MVDRRIGGEAALGDLEAGGGIECRIWIGGASIASESGLGYTLVLGIWSPEDQ